MSNILGKVDAYVTDYVLEPLPRSRPNRTPVNLRETSVPESRPLQEDVEWRSQFFEALDSIESELDRRFDQPGMKEIVAREDILDNSAKRKFSSEDMSKVQLPFDIEKFCLTMRLTLLSGLSTRKDPLLSVPKVAEFVSNLNSQTKSLFKQFENFIGLFVLARVSSDLGKIFLSA